MTFRDVKQAGVSDRVAFWVVFITIACVCFLFLYPSYAFHRGAGQAAGILRAVVASDARFTDVQVIQGTDGTVALAGSVRSQDDLQALRLAVERAHPPHKVAIWVKVGPPNNSPEPPPITYAVPPSRLSSARGLGFDVL
jgi:hypothetical protein